METAAVFFFRKQCKLATNGVETDGESNGMSIDEGCLQENKRKLAGGVVLTLWGGVKVSCVVVAGVPRTVRGGPLQAPASAVWK